MKVLAKATAAIVWHYVNVLKQQNVHLKLHNVVRQLYLNKVGGEGEDIDELPQELI